MGDLDFLSEFTEKVETVKDPYHSAPFYKDLLACNRCTVRSEALQVISGIGPKSAEIIFLGRNPGGDEDKEGVPFIGRGGGELDKWLEILGLDRQKIGISNIVKCHTLNDREPKNEEILICTENWLIKELDWWDKVQIIFPLGNQAGRLLLGPTMASTAKIEGYWRMVKMGKRIFEVCPLSHPGYILRQRGKMGPLYNTILPNIKARLVKERPGIYARSAG